ncbi:MAG: TraB/GumN family protein [Rickettsiales bacterium]
MKFLLSLLLSFTVTSSAFAFDPCAPGDKASYEPIATRYTRGLMFRIEKCHADPSHILGTMHTDNPATIKRVSYAFDTLATAKVAVFEIITGEHTQGEIARYMLYPPENKGLLEVAGQVRFGRLVALLRESQPNFQPAFVNRYRPWAASVLLSFPPMVADGVVLDEKLQGFAREKGIPTKGLESVDQQFKAFTQMSLSQQLSMLDDSLNRNDEIKAMNNRLFSEYRRGDMVKINALGEESFSDLEDKDLADALKQALLIDRNAHMTKTMQPYLNEGNAFVAIGALHLWGADGVLARLEKAGYFVFVEKPVEQ